MNKPSSLSRLLEGLRREPHDYKASLQVFPDLSVDKIAAELELGRKGSERGARNEPASQSASLDEIELRVIERIESERKSAHATLLDELDAYSQRLNALDFEGRFAAIRQAAPEAIGSLRTEVANGRNELNLMRRHLRDLEVEKSVFQKRHGLDRTARASTTGTLVLKVGIILVLLLVETVLNGVFLSKGSELGLLGGTVEALTFAALNILVSFGLGRFGAPEILHRNWLRKLFGVMAIGAFLAFVVVLNLGLAHYREMAGTILDDAGREVMKRVVAQPFGLTDLKSWLFFALGVTFGVIAFLDGVKFDDPYPGYGDLQRRLTKAHDDYIERVRVLVEELDEIRVETNDALEEAGRDLSMRRTEFDRMLESRRRLISLFKSHQGQLERVCNALLGIYREANREARTTPAPKRFATKYTIQKIEEPAELVSKTDRDRLRATIIAAQEELIGHAKSVNEEFEKAAAEYRLIDAIVDERERDGSAAEQTA